MQLNDAIDLIHHNSFNTPYKQTWADLGCGTGLFTLALASLLPAGSVIHATDRNQSALKKIPGHLSDTIIEKSVSDFILDEWPFKNLDGILMANSLHFVKDKNSFITKAMQYTKPNHLFLIVEYDMDKANQWVPYPVSFLTLKSLFEKSGYASIQKLKERPSVYNRSNIYAAIIAK